MGIAILVVFVLAIAGAIVWFFLKNKKEPEKPKEEEVEPKFKVGDWVVNNTTLNSCHIVKVEHGQYICDDCSFPITKENEYHLWSIHNAKDGDVLIDKSGSRECPFIFKETKPSDIKTDILNPLAVLGYCGIGGAGFTKGSGWGDTANCIYYPATKEQRDLLFQKMKEAGYEWNDEKKELKKIEQNPTDEEMKEVLRTEYEKGRADVIAEMQKLVWSEEDTEISSMLIELVESKEESMEAKVEFITWLRSLKDKILPKPKQGWSEEDEKMLEGIIECGEHHLYLDLKDVNWIKSLKDRYT